MLKGPTLKGLSWDRLGFRAQGLGIRVCPGILLCVLCLDVSAYYRLQLRGPTPNACRTSYSACAELSLGIEV